MKTESFKYLLQIKGPSTKYKWMRQSRWNNPSEDLDYLNRSRKEQSKIYPDHFFRVIELSSDNCLYCDLCSDKELK